MLSDVVVDFNKAWAIETYSVRHKLESSYFQENYGLFMIFGDITIVIN